MLAAWLLACALALTPALAATTPITFDSYAAQLDYSPDSTNNTGVGSSWNASFTGFPWSAREGGKRGGQVGTGTGYHWIEGGVNRAAQVSFTFHGTGVEFFGHFGYLGEGAGEGGDTAGESACTLSVAGAQSVPDVKTTGGMSARAVSLGKVANLPLGTYTASLKPTGGIISFTHLVAQMEVGGDASEVSQALANPHQYKPYKLNSDSSLSPDPAFGSFKGAPNSAAPQGSWAGQSSNDNRRVGTKAFEDSVTVNLGVGNSFLAISGTSNSNHGLFRVEFDPAPPGSDARQKYWARTSWQVLETVLIATGLDPDTEYSVTLTNLQNDEKADEKLGWFDITSLTLWKVPTTAKAKSPNVIGAQPKSKVPVGAIAGGVVGGVLLLLAVGVGVWYFKKRTRRGSDLQRASSYADDNFVTTPFVVDPSPPPQPQPMAMATLHPPSLAGPSAGSTSSRQMSWSETSSSPYDTGSYAGSLAGLAAGVVPPGVLPNRPRGPAKLAPQPTPAHHLATDAGPVQPRPEVDDATPVGEMPPTYDPSWQSTSSGPSVAAPDMPGPSGEGGSRAQSAPMGRVIGGSDSKGR